MPLSASRLWREPRILASVLSRATELLTDPIAWGGRLFIVRSGDETIAYCLLRRRWNHQQMMIVFTFPEHRRRGHASRMIEETLKSSPALTYLICEQGLCDFYRNLGFEESPGPPLHLSWRLALINFLSRYTRKKDYVVMVFKVPH